MTSEELVCEFYSTFELKCDMWLFNSMVSIVSWICPSSGSRLECRLGRSSNSQYTRTLFEILRKTPQFFCRTSALPEHHIRVACLMPQVYVLPYATYILFHLRHWPVDGRLAGTSLCWMLTYYLISKEDNRKGGEKLHHRHSEVGLRAQMTHYLEIDLGTGDLTTPLLSLLKIHEILFLYLATTDLAIVVILFRKLSRKQLPILCK